MSNKIDWNKVPINKNKRILALEKKIELLKKENKRLQKKANEMEWGRLTDEP